jgi:cytochrome d ubiquinol oxidase subunit I
MLLASVLTCAFLLAGLAAWQVLKGVAPMSAPRVLRVGLTLGAVVIPLQIVVGDLHGLNTLEHQPQKIAAMEGVWRTERGAPLLLFAIPDDQARENRLAIAIPKLASFILRHDFDAEIRGLDEFRDRHPPVLPVFWAFRVMVGMGVLMLAASWAGWWLYRRSSWQPQRLPRPLLWVLAGMTFSGWVATVAGWYVTEIGRQPYIVHGLIRTADVASNVPATAIALTLALYVVVYLALIVSYVGVLKYMAEKPEQVLATEAAEREATPLGAITAQAAEV